MAPSASQKTASAQVQLRGHRMQNMSCQVNDEGQS